MSDLDDRLRKLSPEQQKLLQKRLRERGGKSKAPAPEAAPAKPTRKAGGKLDFSIFFFSADGKAGLEDPYQLLLESARFVDDKGFKAVWTPERHFQSFGGLYPNPSVISAALAMITNQLEIRAGSVVLPLHSPVRIAEEWALVDNLSKGRVGISFATGWHAHDYVIKPENYADRRPLMFEQIPLVKRLWAGEEVEIPGVDGELTSVRTLPRPVRSELPVWITASSPHTWKDAGRIGVNVLSSMIGNSLEDVERLVRTYREARVDNGHDPAMEVLLVSLR